ncbi:N-acetylglucosamine-6-phosphate deacetylase [Rubripirellula amarantea]|uniref:N-acetylglucosamine-6-phosphate deacetylase n=1 Tax=Rubripirellula amarantea TaxID=2527999 RepID=A0A5C5WWX1_9BACT|nr:N-acetylglucosamine-6-phosphate deacetylase [Rubripirellula amarantea]TWT54362.1 N-acetylglucosamine-6-phosphate deacetylase [Rubripirellula amarantea]
MSGCIDVQVNGYAGVDFNAADLNIEQVIAACRRLRRDGVDRILATVITDSVGAMTSKISRLAQFIGGDTEIAKTIAGIHVEGPFINSDDGYVGAHPRNAVIPATVETAKRLLDSGDGWVRMLTLAPEHDPNGATTKFLSDNNIVIAAGHCDATLDQLRCGIDCGLRMFTHLGNGCPALMNRHDNIIQRVLSLADRLTISFIADGHHVPDYALKNYLRCVPDDHVIITTDAISAAGQGPGIHSLSGQSVIVDSDGAAWAMTADGTRDNHFAGCATTMPKMIEILKSRVGATDQQIAKWTRSNAFDLFKGNL